MGAEVFYVNIHLRLCDGVLIVIKTLSLRKRGLENISEEKVGVHGFKRKTEPGSLLFKLGRNRNFVVVEE